VVDVVPVWLVSPWLDDSVGRQRVPLVDSVLGSHVTWKNFERSTTLLGLRWYAAPPGLEYELIYGGHDASRGQVLIVPGSSRLQLNVFKGSKR